jgi:anti-anti-sigma factor
MADFKMQVKEVQAVTIIATEGYLNNEGGEMIYNLCTEKMSEGKSKFLLNLAGTKVVNSIGVSLVIEVIEKLQEVDGKIGYYNLTPIIAKTFNIMGLTKYSTIFETEDEAVNNL